MDYKFQSTKYYNWLIFAIVNPLIKKAIEKYAFGKILDIGCGEKPYQVYTKNFVTTHIGIDHLDSLHSKKNINVVATAYDIPFQENSIDFLMCTYVLEHLEEPAKAVKEAWRVLRQKSYALYTVPLFWHLHEEPRDFFRFTKHGLRYLFEKNGFEIIELISLTGFSATFAQELSYFLVKFRKGGKLNPFYWLVPPITIFVQFVGYSLNKIEKSEEFSAEYLLVARKK